MDLDTDDEILRTLADGESMDYEQWPALLSRLIPRIEKIMQTEFLVPAPPAPSSQLIPSSPPTPTAKSQHSRQHSPDSLRSTNESVDKENDPPPAAQESSDNLPSQIQTLSTSITFTLKTLFSKYPPHTIQRLAELILFPKQHYRTLSSYLHALDRVVHVTSGANVFPLPPAVPSASSAAILSNGTVDPLSHNWGGHNSTSQANLGSDESLGGALLTPIPWLTSIKNGSASGRGGSHSPLEGEVKTESTEMIEGPNGLGGIETVSVSVNGISSTQLAVVPMSSSTESVTAALRAGGGVTQGELLRQEQRAGVVPAIQLTGYRGDSDGLGEEDELPHARGPEEIGVEDTGLQPEASSQLTGSSISLQGINLGVSIAPKTTETSEDVEMKEEPGSASTPKREAEEEIGGAEKKIKEDETAEPEKDIRDEDFVLVDADGKMDDEKKVGEEGESKGFGAADASAL